MYYATWKQGGKNVCRSTGVQVKTAGISASAAKKLARDTAHLMERTAKGETPVSAAVDALRRTAYVSGAGEGMPSVESYLRGYQATAGAKTEANRRRAFTVFLEYLGSGASMRLDALTPAHIRGFISWALERVSRGTVGLYRQTLSAALNRAVDDDILLKSPMPRNLNLRREAAAQNPELGDDTTKRLPFTAEELRLMIEHFPAPWNDMVLVSFLTGGQRLGDICRLRWDSVDFRGGTISFSTQKTGHALRLPMVDALAARLRMIEREQGGAQEYVFPYMARRHLIQSGSISTEFTALLKAWGIVKDDPSPALKGRRRRVSQKSFHSIRHSFVSLGRSDSSLTADMVRDVVGHKSEAIEREYFTASMAQRAAVLDSMASLIIPAASKPERGER